MTIIQTTLTDKTYFAVGSAPFTKYMDKLPGTAVVYDIEQAQLNPTKVEIELAHASRGPTKAVVHISALDQGPARELAEQEADEATAQQEADEATVEQETEQEEATIQDIASIFIESATAAQNFKLSGNRAELDLHEELFKSADEKFEALIATDSSLYDCELRDIRHAITQGNFNDANARYSALSN